MKSPPRGCLGWSTKVVTSLGLWPGNSKAKRDFLFYFRHIYPRIQPVRMVYGVFCQLINISIVWGDTTRIVEYAAALVFEVVNLVRFVTLFKQRHKIKEMSETIDRLSDPKKLIDDNMDAILSESQSLSRRVTNYSLMFVVVAMAFNMPTIAVNALMTRRIPLRLWFPYNANQTPLFEMTILIFVITVPIESIVVTVSDSIFLALMIQTIGQFRLLSYKIQNIRNLATEKVAKNKLRKKQVSFAHALELGGTQGRAEAGHAVLDALPGCLTDTGEVSDAESVPYAESVPGTGQVADNLSVQDTESVPDFGSVPEIGQVSDTGHVSETGVALNAGSTVGNTTRKKTIQHGGVRVTHRRIVRDTQLIINLEMERHIRQCAKDHQTLLRLVKDLGIAFKTMLWQQIILTAIGGFVMLYITTLAESVDALVVIFSVAMFGFYLEYFLFCWYGHKITDAGWGVRDALYDCDWFGATESFKRSIRLMIARTNKPLVIKGGGLPLSVGTCRLICRASYYVHTLLSKMFHGEKILHNRDV